MRRRTLFSLSASVAILGTAFFAAACGGDDDDGDSTSNPDGKPVIVATTVQIGALTKEVGGDQIALTVLIGPGTDPHDYELTAQDRKRIEESRLIFRHGIGLDGFLDPVLESDGNDEKVLTVTSGIDVRETAEEDEDGDHEGHDHEDGDPHVWQDPENDKKMVDNIANALATADPANSTMYRANAAAYNKVLDETDAEIRRLIDTIPQTNRKVVTNHDSFGYFLDAYGLEFVGAVIPASADQAEASAKEIANLVEAIKRENVRAIFADSSVDPKVADQIASDTGAKVVDDLYGDSLGEPGSGAETVHGMLRHNAERIAEALK